MKLFRILTEDKNAEAVERLVGNYFDGFSMLRQTGYWKGEREASLVIEVMALPEQSWRVNAIAEQIKALNEQEAVLVQTLDVEGEFV